MQRIALKRPRQNRGNARRMHIMRFLRENPGARHVDIARALGLGTNRSWSPVLQTHLGMLVRDGFVRQVEGRWVAVL